ncbi:hypothetical protein EMIT0196MI5_190094 [Pseudomonas sp. IT-196MI5]
MPGCNRPCPSRRCRTSRGRPGGSLSYWLEDARARRGAYSAMAVFFGIKPETIQPLGYAGFSQGDRYSLVLDLVPFVEHSAQKVNDFDRLRSDVPAGGPL